MITADPKLQSLFGTINSAVSGGQLKLLPTWFPANKPVNAALNALGASAGLTITNVDPTYPEGAKHITITGIVTLGGTDFSAEIDIGLDSAQNYTITIELPQTGKTSPLTMTLPGAPWFSVGKPSISVTSAPKLSGTVAGTITVGATTCNAWATLQSDGSWEFALTWIAPGPSIDGVFQFIGGINLAAALPPPLNTIAKMELQTLSFRYDFSKKMLAKFTIAMNATYRWDVFNNGQLVLETLAFTFVNDRTSKTPVTWTAASSFLINTKGPIDVTLSYARSAFTLSGVPDAKATPVTLVDFLDAFLSTAVPSIPASISPGTLKSFNATFARAAGKTPATYTVALQLDGNRQWAFNDKLSVESLGFKVDATKKPVTGSITGTIAFFKAQPHPLTLDVAAVYTGTEWVIDTTQVGKTDVMSVLGGLGIPTTSSLNFSVSQFGSTIHTGKTSPSPYVVAAGAVDGFTMPFVLPVKLERVKGCFGRALGSTGGPKVSPACLTGEVALPFASIAADTSWFGVPITFGYTYAGTPSYTITWVDASGHALVATVAQRAKDQHWIGTIAFTTSTTVGGMVESFVSWATGYAYGLASPWNLLDDISLSGLSLEFDFTGNTVGLTMGFGIDLGFCRITGVTLTYNAGRILKGTKRVEFSIDGTFPWNAGSTDSDATTSKLTWDATKPESTKQPPGKGNGLLDLRLLALGQYVTIDGVPGAKTVEKAIAAFNDNAPAPPSGDTPTLPNVLYDAGTSWLIGLDLGLLQLGSDDTPPDGYCITVQIVFDDPHLYGLRLALAGKPAKVFGGLDFEIMYRKISDTLGVYQAEITLPAKMRTIQTGIYTIQLPTFGISVYTNGDFQIDVGFPWNADFSRSFMVQAIIAPGIPLLGAGGFYFGKLSSASSNSVPAVTNGTFDPVIVFGFGAQVGFGKSVSIGPLSASFSLTVLAIIEGVIARWNGFTGGDQPSEQGSSQIDGAYYYSLTGTFGIAGTLSGSIDFVIIKASVNIAIKVTAQITFAAYAPIVLSINASVDVSASLEINCGLFSFSIEFHFSLDLHESFSIPSPSAGSPPWHIAPPSQSSALAHPHARMTRLRRETPLALTAASGWNATPTWTNLTPAGASVLPLKGYLTFGLSAAADEYAATNPTQVCNVATLVIDAQSPITLPAGATCAAANDTSWDALSKLVARWVVAAFWNAPVGCDSKTGVDALVMTEAQLLTIHEYLANEDAQGKPLPNPIPMPIDPDKLETMLEQQVTMTLTGPADGTPGTKTKVKGAFFPMPGAVALSIPAYGTFPGYAYTFGAYNAIATTDLPLLQRYFDQLAVQVQKEQKGPPRLAQVATIDASALSVAGFVFADYFLLIARQMIANMQAGLRDYKYPYVADAKGNFPSVQAIVDAITAAGGMLPETQGDVAYTAADVFAFNPGMSLRSQQRLTIAGAQATVAATDTFASIAQNAKYAAAFTAAGLALANAENAALLQADQNVAYGGTTLAVDGGETLVSLAARFTKVLGKTVQPSDLANDPAIQQQQRLLIPLAKIALPPFPYTTGDADTVMSVASAFGVTAHSLGAPLPTGDPNPNAAIAGLFSPPSGNAYVDIPHLTQLSVGMLIAEIQRTGALDTLSAMVSRFHFHGLRLPTVVDDGKTKRPLIVPNTIGMWVTGSDGALALPPSAGLFALTGQQFPIPAIGSSPFTITLSGGPSWVRYTTAKSGTIQITNAANDPYDPAIEALRTVVTDPKYRFVTGYTVSDGASQLSRTEATYSFGTYQHWLSAAPPPLPLPAPSGAAPRIWPFPSALSSILDDATHAVEPRFALQTQTYDQATGKTNTGEIASYAFASTFEFTVKRLPTTSSAPATKGSPASGQTYQVAGANASTVVLLEDIVARFPTDAKLWGLWLAYAPDPSLRASGLQTFGADAAFGIGQANLSTVTRPPGGRVMLATAMDAPPANGPTALNGNAMFVRLLWEASITNSGGFYLYYRDGDNGLPEYLFDKHGNAVLTGVLVYRTTADANGGTPLVDCMNAAVVGDPFDPSVSALVAQAVSVETPGVAGSQTLAQIAAGYYADLADVAHRNASVPLAPLTSNVPVAVNEGTFMVPPPGFPAGPGTTPAAIATWFGTTPQAIQTANPGVTWPAAPYTALRLPPLTVVANATAGDGRTVLGSLATIAHYFGADVVGLAVDNQNVANLFGGELTVEAGPWTTAAKLPPGSQLLQLRRDAAGDGDSPGELMLRQFSMLGYRIVANQDFQASNLGVPVGPISRAGGTGVGKLRRAHRLTANATGGWKYDVTLGYAGRVIGASPASSPYLGVGRLLQIDLGWYDLYGNTIASDLSTPLPSDIAPPNQSPTLLGYTDALVGLGRWPSANASWMVDGAFGAPKLELAFTFDTTRYTGKDAAKHAAADGLIYAQLLSQLGDPNGVAFSIETTLASAPIPVAQPNLGTLTSWIAAIASYLAKVAAGQTAAAPQSPLPLTFALPATPPPAQIFALTCAFTFARTGGVVEGEFAAVAGIRSTTTALRPLMPATKAQQNGQSPGLAVFAAAFETAYGGPNATLKVAVGTNRFAPAVASSSTLWAVQVGTPGTPISFAIADAGAPLIFAPQPITTSLVSKSASIWTYTSGTVIDFNRPPEFTQSFTNVDLDQWVRELFAAVDALLGPDSIAALLVLEKRAPGTLAALQAHKKSLAAMYAQQMALVFTDQSGSNEAVAAMFEQAMFEQLGNAYLTQAALQYTAGIDAGAIETIPPNLYGPVVQSGTPVPGVAFTPAKIPLQPPTQQVPTPVEPLCVLVTTPSQSGNTTDSFVAVDLTYTATNVEHQIAPPDGSGYQASSWLQFVLPPASFAPSLGQVDIPMILRAYPSTPILASQMGPSTVHDPATVTEATQWTYAFTYSLPAHYPQDVVAASVEFNLRPNARLMAASFADSFAALAEFVTVYPSIATDLAVALATLATNGPAEQFATARAAVQSFIEILDRIAPAQSAHVRGRRFTVAPHHRALVSATQTTYACSIQETPAAEASPPAIVPGGDASSLLITVIVPAEAGPVPWIELSQQYVDPNDPGGPYTTKRVGPPTIDPTTKATTQQYYVIDAATKKPVPFTIAQGFGPRTVSYPGLQILDLQDAQASASLTRNQNLVSGRTTSDGFVYKTPEVTFTGICRPTIVQTSPINVGAIASPPPPHTVKLAPRSLSDNLTALFYTLVAGASATSASFQLTVGYQYQLSGSPVTIPILMQPALQVSWAPGNDTLAAMIADLTSAITGWFGDVEPIGGGQLLISLTVLTTVTQQLVPLVRLTSLELSLTDIAPRLTVTTLAAPS